MRRRDFLEAGALATAALGLPPGGSAATRPIASCIFLHLTGGPSHLDTWDMKPNAPTDIRGPFRPIRTNVPGMEISEIFPRMARIADKFAIVRGVHYEDSPMHETGMRLIRTGMPCGVELPRASGAREVAIGESERTRERYEHNRFGQGCLLARRLVERGAPFVNVRMFDTVYGETTWDSHGYAPFSTIRAYRDAVGPSFDAPYTALITDLNERGLLATTMVIASGEFGRSPRINSVGGRDHWPQCWSVLVAGGGVRGGQVIGSSDATGAYPKDRPVSLPEIAATVRHCLNGCVDPIPGVQPIRELFV